MSDDRSDEWTDNPLRADDRNFSDVETKVDRLLYVRNHLEKARDVFAKAIKHRPRIRPTTWQRTRVLEQWPKGHSGLSHSLSGRITRRAEKYA